MIKIPHSRESGEFLTALGTDVTGPANATRAVIDIYDVFGLASQTIQGADRLSQHIGDCLVFVPDLLEGNYVKPEWMPPDTPEKQKLFAEFRAGPGSAGKAVARVLRVRKEIAEKYPGVEGHVVVGGLCWGGKISVLACGPGNEGAGRKFNASWTAHPG